jgi:hypothetical protein
VQHFVVDGREPTCVSVTTYASRRLSEENAAGE